jgi:hypothetical protein
MTMDRRILSILLLALAACTGRRVNIVPTVPSQPSSSATSVRTRTVLNMEVGLSVHPGSFRATGLLTDGDGAPVAGAVITVTLTPVGGGSGSTPFELGTPTTDAKGQFQVTFHPPHKGTFLVKARFAGNDRLFPATNQGPVTAT